MISDTTATIRRGHAYPEAGVMMYAPVDRTEGVAFALDCAVCSTRLKMALATVDLHGRADLSPKGDPAGSMARMAGDRVWFADRPGNRRADSFRNIIGQPRIAAVLLIPGSSQVAMFGGTARLTADEAMRAQFTVQSKMPRLATYVEGAVVELRPSGAFKRARLCPMAARADGIDPAKMFVAHVKLNKSKGLGAKLAGAVLPVSGLMQKGLDKDYEKNLY